MMTGRFISRGLLLLAHGLVVAVLTPFSHALPSGDAFSKSAAPSAAPDQLDLRFANGVAAVAEDKVITVDDVRREIQPLIQQLQREAKNEKEFNDRLDALRDDIIQNLIDRVLIVKEFRKDEKKHIPASYVDNQIAEILVTQFENDRSKFLSYLHAQGKTNKDYRKEVEEDIIYNYMRTQQRKSQSIVSPVKVETFYNENRDKFFQEDSVDLRLVQLKRNSGETDEQLKSKANEILARFKAGEKFEDLAKEYSQDIKRSKGGDWGWLKHSDLKPELSEPVFKLDKSHATEPIILPEGAFILYVEDKKIAGVQKLDDVRDQIEHLLVQQMARASQEHWLERLRRNGYVKHY